MSDTQTIRHGEELDAANLREFLGEKLNLKTDQIEIRQFPSGASNLTYSLQIGGEEFVLRRPPFGNTVKSAHDMKREFDILDKLSKVYPPAPQPLLYTADETIIGSEFFLMERRRGLIIRGQVPEILAKSKTLQRRVGEEFIANLARLHALDYQKIGIGGKPEGYAQRQVAGWTKRYFDAQTDNFGAIEKVIEWLNKNVPADEAAALIHNDYKFDNLMLAPDDLTAIVAVLDWEMATIGSPLMDLGTTLGYWMSAEAGEQLLGMPFNPRVLMLGITRRELVEIYAREAGRDVSNILFYYVFGSFKIAVIAQQIYARFARGLTRDRRFESFNRFADALGRIALAAIERGRI